MNKWISLVIGTAAGLASGALYLYLFAPARDTTFDANYQSRLDWALEEGKKAGAAREQELILELQQARISPPIAQPPADLPPVAPPVATNVTPPVSPAKPPTDDIDQMK